MNDPRNVLASTFGFPSFYPVQEQVVGRTIHGQHSLVVMPTGSGKSLCYQVPALCLEGTAIVLSPLIALMEDQVTALRARGVAASYVNSTLPAQERQRRYDQLAAGEFKLIYVTPERFRNEEFLKSVCRASISLLAVDEAHCISRWGHDFRPDYSRVGEFRQWIGAPPTVALTATATPDVQDDIRRILRLTADDMPLFFTGIERPNLSLDVQQVWHDGQKLDRIRQVISAIPGTGIVYFTLIRDLDRFASQLRGQGYPVRIYHGELRPDRKKAVYKAFMRQNPLVLCATNAFGMGVDKPDIRYVIHAQVPASVEAYYQEVGRAGRDGQPSQCILLYDADDLAIQQEFIDWMNPDRDFVLQAAAFVEENRDRPDRLNVETLRRHLRRDPGDYRADYVVRDLERRGVITYAREPGSFRFAEPLDPDSVDDSGREEKRLRDLQRLQRMVDYVRHEGDRKEFLKDYFLCRGLTRPSGAEPA